MIRILSLFIGVSLLLSPVAVGARYARDMTKEDYDSVKESTRQELGSLMRVSTADFTAKLAELNKTRDELRAAHRAEVERLSPLSLERLAELIELRAEQRARLLERSEELRSQNRLGVSERVRQDRLKRASAHANVIIQRLKAALARTLALANKIQTRISQMESSDVKDTLSSQLAQLTVTESELNVQIADAQAALITISTSDDPAAAAVEARVKVEAAVTTLRTLYNAYAGIVNQLP